MRTNEEMTQHNATSSLDTIDEETTMSGFDAADWKSRIIAGRVTGAAAQPPAWLDASYETLREQVMDPAYPCFFGTMAERRGEMFYSFVNGKDIRDLPATMQTFAELASLPQYRKNNIAVFFEPDAVPLSHDDYHGLFWDALQQLHNVDPDPTADQQPEPSHEDWEFSFAGVQMFVVCACPSFQLRHSRNLGPGMVLLFQPRSVFVDTITNKVIGREARNQVRKRLETWDDTPAHPDLGFYGDPGNLEWKQYFLDDKNVAAADVCPFLKRKAREAGVQSAVAKPAEAQAESEPALAGLTSKPAAQPQPQPPAAPQPDMAAIARSYAGLPSDKRATFRARLRERGMSGKQLPVMPLEGRSHRFPLSSAQARLWFLWQLSPDDASYNIAGALRLEGALDVERLRAALDHVVARHESLRTHFEENDGQVAQIVGGVNYAWSQIDATDAVSTSASASLDQRLQALSLEPFDLTRGPLLRVALLREGSAESAASVSHVLHVSMHHIIADHASVKLLLDEFVAAYGDLCEGRSLTAAALPVQYGDFAAWQQEWSDDGERETDLQYWTGQLGDTPAALELPVTKKRAGIRNVPGARVGMTLDAAQTRALKQLAAAHRTTLFTLLLSAYAVLLARYTGQKDVRIGVPVSGRSRLETERLIGFFVNTLVIRADLNHVPSFGALLGQLHQCVLDAHRHDALPFAQLVEVLQPERSAGQTPLFQVMFNHTRAQRVAFDVAGLHVSELSGDLPTARFDLVLNAVERDDTLRLSFNYAADLFDEAIVQQMLDHLGAVLAQAASVVDQPLSQIALTHAQSGDAHALRTAFDATGARFSRRAALQPHAPALHCEGERLAYGELERWTNRIAARLNRLGVTADQRIGLCVERSAALAAGVLGVLKSGAAFVPLDPAYPLERLAAMLDDAGIERVLVDQTGAQRLGDLLRDREAVDIAALADSAETTNESAHADSAPCVAAIHPEQLAYVIYTSGSTGRPKGVAITHGTLSQHLDDFIGTYGIAATDKVLQSSTINFDVALHELLPALLMGGQVEMRGPQLWDPETTSRHLIEEKVTFSRIPTAYWQQWLRDPPSAASLASLRQITVGGEGLPGDALRQWRNGPLGHIRLDNLYGPTETTIACMFRETRALDEEQAIVSIGGPYPSRSVRMCDADGNDAPPGATGELCIGGYTLARGYLGRAALTAERFVPDPHGPAGSRLYRTGDLCRRRLDGSIDFLGRLDQQIKLRGYRIELGEIEAVLREAPGVEAAAAALRGEGDAKRLVGYVVGDADDAVVRRVLQSRLPGYMVPSSLMWLDRLPTMQNGKLDRAALPEPGVEATRQRTAARTPLEASLLAIWKTVLGHDEVGVTDNFFEAGGHSLLMMRVASRIRQELELDVSLRTLFLNPVLADLAAELDAQAPRAADRMTRREAGARIPLTDGQERLWFLWKLEPDSAAYTISGAVNLTGALDRNAVRRALDGLLDRHESLRTRFVEADGQPWQVVDDARSYDWREEHAGGADELDARLKALTRMPFDLERGPMLRVTLLTNPHTPDDTVLHFAMPHIVSDAWSQAILLREFGHFYEAAIHERAPSLPALPVQYGDYAVWQRARHDPAAHEAQCAYWADTLGGEQPLLALPADRPRHGARSSAGATLRRTLDAALTSSLDACAHEHGATRFMTLLAAFGSLLQGYSGQQDVRVGVPVAGRDRLETESLLGFFVNTLVIRMTTPRSAPFVAMLDEVRDRVVSAHAHADVPFASLVERLQPQRSVAHTPLFQAMFNYSAQNAAPLALPGIVARTLTGVASAAQFDLSLDVAVDGDGLKLSLTYATDIFEHDTATRLLDSYLGVLHQIARDPAARNLALLDDSERQRLLACGRNDLTFDAAMPVHRLFERQAESTPDAIALQFDGQTLTYRELDARANRLAHRLTTLGVGPDVKVGIGVERSLEMVVGLLAVLKAGGAYVPLDPSIPAARRAYMAADSGVRLLLTQSYLAQRDASVDGLRDLPVLELDRVNLDGEPSDRVTIDVHGESLAYVIYTSGSTGKPKGVMVTHAALGHFILGMQQAPGLAADDVLVAVTSLSFDIAALELYLPLSVGARIVIASRETTRDGAALARLVDASDATALQSTPAGWRLLRAGGWPFSAPVRFKALCGGEALQPDLARDLHGLGIDVWNMYGPTETTIWSAAGRVTDASPALGAPVAGTQLYVLDANLDLAPANVAGELYIGGVGLARGYMGRRALTATQFVASPFDANGGRLYRTGDLAMWRADGRLDYLGRIDHQVKIRGFRIELGEIEAQLLTHADVREAVVVARDAADGARLVAYVAPRADASIDTATFGEQLRQRLGAVLPDYMVPATVITLDRLPLNANGKVDRHALPEPVHADARWEAPQGDTETLLAAIWQPLLRVERIGRRDHFFELGGQSLLALRVVAALRASLKTDVPVRLVFASPVLADLARAVAELAARDAQAAPPTAAANTWTDVIPARAAGLSIVPLSAAQARLWFFSRLNPHSAAYNLPGAVKLDGALDRDALRAALSVLVARHESLRTRFVETDGVPMQVIEVTEPVLSVLDFEDVPHDAKAQRVADALYAISRAPFALEHGPLLRVTLIRLGACEHVLHVVTHHIVSDAWSNQLILDEFSRAYAAILQGRNADLAPLPVQYADYALWQHAPAQLARAEAELDFWRMRLGGEQTALELPFDRRPPATRNQTGGRVSTELASTTVDAVRALSRRHDATGFMVLLAAFDVLLARYSGQQDIRVGVPATGRDRLETQQMVGFFVNTLVVRSDLRGLDSVAALVQHVRERVLEAQAHQDVPFARVVDALSPDRSLTQTPLFSVMFNYDHGAQGGGLSLPGLRASQVDTSTGTARFDLVLSVRERADGMAVSLTYARDVFDASTVETMLDRYVSVLEQIVADEHVHPATLQLAPELAQRAVDPLHAHPFAPIGARIAAQAQRQPAAPAVHCEGERLTYGELDAWSAQIARTLQARGANAETRVGLCLTRSAGLVAALVGVLRSGAAFVPLDPAYPAERLRAMIDEAQLSCVLGDAATLASCGALFAGRDAFDIATLKAASADAASAVHAPIHPEQLAYVIYTSGSAGRPKGVAVSHHALSRHLDDFIGTNGITARDTQLQSSTINFDVALHEMLPALIQGGQVEMRGPQLWDIDTTSRHLKEGRVTFSRIPTAYWQQWLRTPPPAADLASLRQITVGGEGLPGDALAQWRDGPLAHIRLDNLYGPTETTVACMYRETRAADADQTIVSIGEPYGSRCVYVMDRDGNELPDGALGELCIGGLTLARGYLDRPGLSAASFIPDPLIPGARLYRSGDLCRRRADGSIDFLGRLDQQVKLRGFRIELGEIEAVLREAPGVEASAVALHGEGDAKRLVGYFVGDADETTARGVLESRLPAYMVPAALVRLERLPLMQNGKLDRHALPAPHARDAAAKAAPQTPLEAQLLGIWQDVLPRGEFGVTDNFFDAGGHSLLALKVLAKAKDAGLPGVTLEALFQHATVRALAAHLGALAASQPATQNGAASPAANVVSMSTRTDLPTVFAIHPASGLVADYRPLAAALDGVASVYGVQAPFYTEDWWPGDLSELAADYAARIRSVQPHGPYRLIGWSVGGLIATEVARVLAQDGGEVPFVGLIDAYVLGAQDTISDEAPVSYDQMRNYRAADAELQKVLDDSGKKWPSVQGGLSDAGTRALLSKVLLFQRHIGHIVRYTERAPVPVDLKLWWARHRPHRPAREAIASWTARTTGRVLQGGEIDADHKHIVRHSDLFDDLARAIVASAAHDTHPERLR
ncbi:non-ribosomal peptide synthetase [Paraburkholderia sp.]|uniref:non-ribosomal peptide synthetase n=1 Tax=Paraburkholderia sp. TaxID=1926495 RepID=UPI0023A6A8D3|nr:non-ribosomal peptide synthetase [Paraburkholderia sp.]MDE1182644.1 amino acid adenylation domain-containing protein [Paraburkholderia sp.]